mmetsp:Transcript_110163/g.310632  ORF Transcript_110163/g.310632 Transcript_110163/m.310632 type:complete len:605 (+) Transcript_110163:88-1902(+)
MLPMLPRAAGALRNKCKPSMASPKQFSLRLSATLGIETTASAWWVAKEGETDIRNKSKDAVGSTATVIGTSAVSNTELLLQVSRLIEDDPNLADKFAKCMSLDARASQRLEELCNNAENAEICPPSSAQLHQVCMAAALPFVGFGFLDNAVMIAFGDVIDATLCTACGFSTMAAAALGNTFSDGIGVYSGGVVEDIAAKCGYEAPPLSRAQQAMDVTKRAERIGQLCGITLGCLLGMFPLLLIDSKQPEMLKRDKALNQMFEHVVVAVEDMLDAEAAMIVFVDNDKNELYSRCAAHHGKEDFEFRAALGEGIMGHVASSGNFLNVKDLRTSKFYSPQRHNNYRGTGIDARSVLCVPIMSYDADSGRCDRVIGVVEVINKKDGGHFTEKDEDALAALCAHISSSFCFVKGEEFGFNETLERCARVLRMKGARINAAQHQRAHALYTSILAELAKVYNIESASLLNVNVKKDEVIVLATNNGSDAESEAASSSLAESRTVAEVTSTRKALIVDGSATEGCGATEICCPIFDDQREVIGALQLRGKRDGSHFNEQDAQFLETLAARLSNSLQGPGSSLAQVLHVLQERGRESFAAPALESLVEFQRS